MSNLPSERHDGPDAATAGEYQSLSGLAIVSLVLGIASALVFVAPMFLFLPVAAIGVALAAQAQIRRSDGALAGGHLARIGVALAVAFTAAAFVRDAVRDNLLQRQASQAALHWFDLLADGRFDEAGNMLSGPGASALIPQQAPGSEGLSEKEARQIVASALEADPLTATLRGKGGVRGKAVVESMSDPFFDGPKTMIGGEFAVGTPGGAHRHVRLEMTRARAYEAAGRPWRIDRWESGEEHGAH